MLRKLVNSQVGRPLLDLCIFDLVYQLMMIQMETWTRLRQVGLVAHYKGQFEALSNRIKELS